MKPVDAVVVGSGFGGAMAAHSMVSNGMRVLMLERGDAVPEGPGRADPVRGGPTQMAEFRRGA